jgi:hypothetical protein
MKVSSRKPERSRIAYSPRSRSAVLTTLEDRVLTTLEDRVLTTQSKPEPHQIAVRLGPDRDLAYFIIFGINTVSIT